MKIDRNEDALYVYHEQCNRHSDRFQDVGSTPEVAAALLACWLAALPAFPAASRVPASLPAAAAPYPRLPPSPYPPPLTSPVPNLNNTHLILYSKYVFRGRQLLMTLDSRSLCMLMTPHKVRNILTLFAS